MQRCHAPPQCAHHPLYVSDPVKPTNNAGVACYRIGQIQKLFREVAAAAVTRLDAAADAVDGEEAISTADTLMGDILAPPHPAP